jgi:alkaline phosphatase D
LDVLANWITSLQPKAQPVKQSTTTVPADPIEEAEYLVSDAFTAVASATETPVTESSIVKSLLTEAAPRELTPEFMIMAGDTIYADVPHWSGDNLEYYRKLYRRTFSSLSFRKIYEKLRTSSNSFS